MGCFESFEHSLFTYYLRLKSSSDFIHDATMISSLPVIFFGDDFKHDVEKETIFINEKLKFTCSENTGSTIMKLRERLNWFLAYKVAHPGPVIWEKNEEGVKILRYVCFITLMFLIFKYF